MLHSFEIYEHIQSTALVLIGSQMANDLKLKSIKFKAGSSVGQSPLVIDCPNVTVLIGPNNSGKSQTLREIEADCISANTGSSLVIDGLEIEMPTDAGKMLALLDPFDRGTPPGNSPASPGYVWLRRPSVGGSGNIDEQIHKEGFPQWISANERSALKKYFVRFLTRRLDGATRFNLVAPQSSGPLDQAPINHLWALFMDQQAREKVSAFTESAFGRYFVIDPTGMTEFRIRLSDRKPTDIDEEQALGPRARAFHEAASLITNLGDGVKASVGLVAAIHSLPDRILLVDEPEAFLHPTLARRIGQALSDTARERDASMVVATHSAEFLIGCLQSTPDLRLVRLTFELGQATARTLEPADVTTLMKDPLLRSANAIRALFHRGVVVCEADSDRAFYEEINARLVNMGRGIDDALFMNAQNWQTIPRIIEPLRRVGVPAAGIFDFDVLMDKDFKHLWPLVQVDQVQFQELQNDRACAKALMESTTRAKIKKQGLAAFTSATDRAKMEGLLKRFAAHGMFFVAQGELEGWLSYSGISAGDKAKWVLKMFEYMGADPLADGYVDAGTDDVWGFLSSIKDWIDDPTRQGIPA